MAYTKEQAEAIRKAKEAYEKAKKNKDKAGQLKAHADADKARGFKTTTITHDGSYIQADVKKYEKNKGLDASYWSKSAQAQDAKNPNNPHKITLPDFSKPQTGGVFSPPISAVQTMDRVSKEIQRQGIMKEQIPRLTYQEGYYENVGVTDKTWGNLGKESLKASATGWNSSLASALDLFIPSEVLGKYDVISPVLDYYKDADRDQQKKVEWQKDTEAKKVVGDMVTTTVRCIPDMILVMATAGMSKVGTMTSDALGIIAGNATKAKNFATTLQNAVTKLGENPMFWTSFTQITGQTYEKELANGASETEAQASALLNGILGSAVEVGGGIQTFKWGDKGLMKLLKTIMEEAGEEGVQAPLEELINKAVGSDDAKWFSMDPEEEAVINPPAIGYNMLLGGVAGGFIGGAQQGSASAIDKLTLPKAPKPGMIQVTTPDGKTKWIRDTVRTTVPEEEKVESTKAVMPETLQAEEKVQEPAKERYNEVTGPLKQEKLDIVEHIASVTVGRNRLQFADLPEHMRATADEMIADGMLSINKKGEVDVKAHNMSWDEINNIPALKVAKERSQFDKSESTHLIDTPERHGIRKQVKETLLKLGSFTGIDKDDKEIYDGEVRKERIAHIVLGISAGGKSSVLVRPLSKDNGARVIDADMAKELLPEFDGGYGAGKVHQESSDIVELALMDDVVERGENFVIPLVGKNTEKIKTIADRLKKEGYTVNIHLNELPAEKATRRAISRFFETGRYLDPEMVLGVADKPTITYETLRKEGIYDGYIRKSNDVKPGEKAVTIEEHYPGKTKHDPGRGRSEVRQPDKDVRREGQEKSPGSTKQKQVADVAKTARDNLSKLANDPTVIKAMKALDADAKKHGGVDSGNFLVVDHPQRKNLEALAKVFHTQVVFLAPQNKPADFFNGVYLNGKIYISVKSDNPMNVVFGHELMHQLKVTHPADFAKFAKIAIDNLDAQKQKQYMKGYESVGEFMQNEELVEEICADFSGEMFNDPTVMRSIFEEDASLAKKIYNLISRMIKQINQNLSVAYQVKDGMKDLKAVQAEYVALVKKAVKESNDEAVISETESNIKFNVKTYRETGRSYLNRWLKAHVNKESLTQEDADEIMDSMDRMYAFAVTMKGEHPAYGNWAEMAPVVDDQGNPVMSIVVPNGDYPMNIDFSTICKKRRPLNDVLNELIQRDNIDVGNLTPDELVKISDIIAKHDLEVACALCFVDAKRYRVGSWASDFSNYWNSVADSLVEGTNIRLDEFNYAQVPKDLPKNNLASRASDGLLKWDYVNSLIGGKTSEGENAKPMLIKIAKLMKADPNMRRRIVPADIMTDRGLDRMMAKAPDMFKILNAHGGTSKPKMSHADTPANNEILKLNGWTPEGAYAVGGVRVQSFSDYVGTMFFDYMQAVAELSAKKLPAHGYAKEKDFVLIFGQTGIRINMSLIPKVQDLNALAKAKVDELAKKPLKERLKDPLYRKLYENAGLDKDGNYLWAKESFDFQTSVDIQNMDGYDKYVGNIAVGVSDKHIRKMMDDPDIRMIIPYHKSGINPAVALAKNIGLFKDYTLSQGLRWKSTGLSIGKNDPHFDWYGDLAKTNDPQKTTANFLAWCDEQGMIPTFDQFAYKDAGKKEIHPGYYKLLIDFDVYDKNGNYSPQGPAKMNFPGNVEELIQKSLDANEETETKKAKAMASIVDEIEAMVKHSTKRSLAETDSTGKSISREQQEYFKSTKARKGSKLLRLYHGTAYDDFNVLVTETPFYMTDNRDYANVYVDEEVARDNDQNGRVMELYANIENPVNLGEISVPVDDDTELERIAGIMGVDLADIVEIQDVADEPYMLWGIINTPEFIELAKSKGFDGLTALENGKQSWAVFSPGQVKYANNYNPTVKSDMRYSTKRSAEQEHFEQEPKYSIRRSDPPKKTITAYKLLRTMKSEPGKLFPLFVEANKETPIDTWLDAEAGPTNPATGKVKSKLGDLAYRPGWHLGDIPHATHIGVKGPSGNIEFMSPDHVWVECEVSADVDFQEKATQMGYRTMKGGKKVPSDKYSAKFADLDEIPVDGMYRYKTNPNMTGEWIIAGSIKINRILTKEEVDAIVRKAGHEPLPQAPKYSKKVDSEGKALSDAQAKYFKNSKARDEDGNLLKVYHGTEAEFTVFDRDKGRSGMDIQGSFFSPWELDSKGYGRNVKPYYLNIVNPASEAEGYSALNRFKGQDYAGKKATEYLISRGYDGVNFGDEEYVAFYPHQIKSVDNLDPTSDPDIRKSLKRGNPEDQAKRVDQIYTEVSPIHPLTAREKASEALRARARSPKLANSKGLIHKKMQELGRTADSFEHIARTMTDSKHIKPSRLETMSGIKDQLKRKFIDAGDTVAKIAKISGDPALYYYYNNARNARRRAEFHIGEAQTDINGKIIGKSLKEIFDPIRKNPKKYTDFQDFMYHLHNQDRMALEARAKKALDDFKKSHPDLTKLNGQQKDRYDFLLRNARTTKNKPVYGKEVEPKDSKRIAEELLANNPEFLRWGQQVRDYLDNMVEYRVDAGLWSEEQADMMAEMYQNYVPTYRLNPLTKGIKAMGTQALINRGLKRATGSDKDLLPLHEQLAKQTMQTIDASHKNLFGMRLAQDLDESTMEYVQEIQKAKSGSVTEELQVKELKNTFTVYEAGVAFNMKIDDGLFEAVQALAGKSPNTLLNIASSINSAFKQLITAWSPMFMVRNFARDLQDVGLYSKYPKDFLQMYAGAIHEIATNGPVWKQYKALGGAGNSFFDYESGYMQDHGKARSWTVDKVEAFNLGIEQAPRLAEFMATIKNLNHSPTYDDLMTAMYNSADVTVNFGRSGTWGKTINSTFVPFFNPAMQGASKLVRRFTETKGIGQWTGLIIRATLLGIVPSVLNAWFYRDDEDYEKLDDNVKDINYLIKISEHEFIKIPKGRVLSLFGATSQRIYEQVNGTDQEWAGLIRTGLSQVAPISPFESNIVSPLLLAKFGKTWYGGDIEPQRVTDKAPHERYTEGTTELSKALVGRLGKLADTMELSPMKMDYILDAYSGIIGDIALPLMTPKAENNPFLKAFVIDAQMQNRLSNDFYNAKTEIMNKRNSDEGSTLTDDVMNRYMNQMQSKLSDLYEESRAVQMGEESDAVKKVMLRDIQAQINAVQAEALSNLKDVQETTDIMRELYDETDPKALDVLSREVNREVFGSEYALDVYNQDVYEKAKAYVDNENLTWDTYYDAYFELKDISSDKYTNSKGNIVSVTAGTKADGREGESASRKKYKMILEMGLSEEANVLLYKAFSVSDKVTGVDTGEKNANMVKYEAVQDVIGKDSYVDVVNRANELGGITQANLHTAGEELGLSSEQRRALYVALL